MELSDLEYFENLSAKNSRASGGQDQFFTKELNSTVTNAATFNVTADIFKNINKDINVNQDVDLRGNFANLFGDVEAMGPNTLSDMEFSIYTIANELSSMSVLAEAASYDPSFTAANGNGSGNG